MKVANVNPEGEAMDLKAILKELKEDPDAAANADFYRELLDNSEALDTDALREFVDQLDVKSNGKRVGDRHARDRRAIDRSLTLSILQRSD